MKKANIIFMALLASVIVCSCGAVKEPVPETTTQPPKPETVVYVEGLIDEIGEVTITSKDLIEKAEKEYGYLKESEKEQVDNSSTLKRARDEYDELFHQFILGEWAYNFTATEDSSNTWSENNTVDSFSHKGDELMRVIVILENGDGRLETRNLTLDRTDHFEATWNIKDNTLFVKYTMEGIGVNINEYVINFEKKSLDLDMENGEIRSYVKIE